MVTLSDKGDQKSDDAVPQKDDDAVAQKADDAVGSVGTGLLGILTCQRRRSPDVADEQYQKLLLRGRRLPAAKKQFYAKLAWWTPAKTKSGARIFVVAVREIEVSEDVPHIDMWDLASYVLYLLHDPVVSKHIKYAIVWAQYSEHRAWPRLAYRFKTMLPAPYRDRIEAVHVVHPSWTVRILRLLLWPVASEEFWDYFYSHERVEFLDTVVDIKALKLPDDLHRYDKFLDTQAQEMSEQARRQMGHHGYGMDVGIDAKKEQGQLAELERLLRERNSAGTFKED